ncbi:MAG: conjugal transfer protein TraG N-terminal domain-containing protein [Alphaproteobacteria bacterium]
MDYSIYTFGSGEIIEKVLNVLALLCQNENVFFRPVLALSASVGALWAGLQAMYGGNIGAFIKVWMLPTILIFNLMFVPRVTVNIIDQVDTFHHYSRVENVPVGPALIAHVSSSIAYHLTEAIEERLVPADYADLTYGKSGPMLAAYLMASSRNLVVADPILRENVKNYVDQCFTWPYLYTNIAPGKEEALKSTNILEFMKSNPHPGLGMYWKESTGKPTFMMCSKVPEKLNPAMKEESARALSRLADQVLPGISSQNPAESQKAMTLVGESAWHTIAKDSSNAHQRVEQQMIINAGREAIDDGLEKFGMQRRYARLISYSATRAEEQQNTGFLIMGATAARQLPVIQGVFLGLLLISFVFVCACTFLPGGLKIWGTWIKMMFWVQSWPVFFGILNCLGLLWLNKSVNTVLFTHGEGISWLTQNGLADASWNAYCIVQNLFFSIPFLSWALISGSGHALVSMAERVLPTVGTGLGQSIVDNTQSFDTQSFHNKTIGSMQLAQQQLGANYSLSSSTDDGRFRTTTGPSGYQNIQEHMSSTRHAINSNESIQAQFSEQLSSEQQAMQSLSESYTDSKNTALDKSYELTKAFAQGKAHVKGASESENRDIQKSAQEMLSANERYAKQHTLTEGIAWSVSAGVPLEKIPVIGPVLESIFSTGGTSDAGKQDFRQFARDTGINRDVAERLSQGFNAALTDNVSFSEDSSKRTAESFRSSMTDTQNYSSQLSAQQSKVDRLQEMSSLMESQGINITQNLNDDVLEYVAAKHNWSKETAAKWSSDHASSFREEASSYIQGWTQNISSWLESKSGPLSSTSIDDHYQSYKNSVFQKKSSMTDPSHGVRDQATQEGVGFGTASTSEQNMDQFYENTSSKVEQNSPDFGTIDQKMEGMEDRLKDTRQAAQKEFRKFDEKGVARRALKVAWDKGGKRVLEDIGLMDPNARKKLDE